MFTFEFDHFDWLSQFYSEWRETSKLLNFQDFFQGIQFSLKFNKPLKLRNSVKFMKKTLVNQVYFGIWSFWLIFTVLQWMKTNFKINQFPIFLLRYAIQVLDRDEHAEANEELGDWKSWWSWPFYPSRLIHEDTYFRSQNCVYQRYQTGYSYEALSPHLRRQRAWNFSIVLPTHLNSWRQL